MKRTVLALFKTGEVVDLLSSSNLPGSELSSIIRCEYEGNDRDNEFWSYSVFDNALNAVGSNSFEWHGFVCKIANCDDWLYPLDDWHRSAHKWTRIRTVISKTGSKPITINLRHTFHKGEAFRTLSKILLIAKEQGLVTAKEEFGELSAKEPGT